MLIVGYLGWGRRPIRAGQVIRQLWPVVAILGAFVLAQTAFRLIYYDSILPNTYTLKVVGYPLLVRIKNGFGFLAPFFGQMVFGGTLAILGCCLDFSWEKVVLFTIPLSLIAYQVWMGGDIVRLWRFLVPGIPLLILLSAREVLALSGSVIEFAGSIAFQKYVLRAPIWEAFPRLGILTRRVRNRPVIALGAAGPC